MNFLKSKRQELERQHTLNELKLALKQKEQVVYRENGNRHANGKTFLKKIEQIAPKIGVTRNADISYLGHAPYPVIQSCRPNYLTHSSFGQNSGAQGKGRNQTQATISCLMETIEGFCCEPRNPELIRASYDFLKDHKLVYDPRKFVRDRSLVAPNLKESFMWTPAYCLVSQLEVLVPAELIYFPFLAADYETRSLFPSGTNGLASGSTYLEATIHALYEVIERNYIFHFETGDIKIEALYDQEIEDVSLRQFKKQMANEYEVQFYALEHQQNKNLPCILCAVVSQGETHLGWGLSGTVDISISRAFSEALQSLAANISGTREDLASNETDGLSEGENDIFDKTPQPQKRTLRIKDYKKRVHDQIFKSLNEELDFILKWLRQRGCTNVFVANLTRVGVDVPVVKVVIPGFEVPQAYKVINTGTQLDVYKKKFPNMGIKGFYA